MRTRLRAVIVDPEVVFVANLMKADAPALVASFQGDFNLVAEEDGTQNMRANLRDLKVLACPFIQNKEDKSVTTVSSDPVELNEGWSRRSCRPILFCLLMIGAETLLCLHGNQNQSQPTTEWLCDGGGGHHQSMLVGVGQSLVENRKC